MSSPKPDVRALLELDRLVHEPARLAILTILAAAEEVEFLFLEETTGLTKGNLSSHLSKLETGAYLTVKKSFKGKVPATSLRITREGRRALDGYRRRLFVGLEKPG
jgi:DNA-binding transcriptional ArsR family regulator